MRAFIAATANTAVSRPGGECLQRHGDWLYQIQQQHVPGGVCHGRLASDAAGTLQAEVQLKAGEIAYTSFETTAPRRWGDYTEMTIAPTA
jgi:hypothetical protein